MPDVEMIKADAYSLPYNKWVFTTLDWACFRIVIRGTWIYDINFGAGNPLKVIPHNLQDQVVIWPASRQ